MIVRVCIAVILFSLFFPGMSFAEKKTIARLSFDDTTPDIGAEDYRFYRNSKGFIDISQNIVFSGARALEIREKPFDGNFVELQGVFPVVRDGLLYFSFGFLVENPEETFNVALAGPGHFTMRSDGLSFWLSSKNGKLLHHSDSIPKKLLKIEAYEWYFVDVLIDLEHGTYTLSVQSESGNQKPVLLERQSGPVAAANLSASKYSFIGDLGDISRVHYFVDDILIEHFTERVEAESRFQTAVKKRFKPPATAGTPRAAASASGAQEIGDSESSSPRLTFIESYLQLEALQKDGAECLPATSLADFGIGQERAYEYASTGILGEALEAPLDAMTLPTDNTLSAIVLWRRGCERLAKKEASVAGRYFEDGLKRLPQNTLIEASRVIALAGDGKYQLAKEQALTVGEAWADDPRYNVLISAIHRIEGDLPQAERWLKNHSEQIAAFPQDSILGSFLSGDVRSESLIKLKKNYPESWRSRIDDVFIAQAYYVTFLQNGKYSEAIEFSRALQSAYKKAGFESVQWKEREADASYMKGSLNEAAALYEELRGSSENKRAILKKLADVYHSLKLLKKEQGIRRDLIRLGNPD